MRANTNYMTEVTCSVCGGAGVAVNSKTVAAEWRKGNIIQHTDLNICYENLKTKGNAVR